MSVATPQRPLTVALIGNPNTGKTTLFNLLTGMSLQVGNYPGVTVERRSGKWEIPSGTVRVIDLPGTYSLAARSPDERIVTDVLRGRQAGEDPVDLVIAMLDAASLERNLYLFSQIRDFGLPIVACLNMMDVAMERGIRIDRKTLSDALGVPVIPMQASRREGISELVGAVESVLGRPGLPAEGRFPLPETTALSKEAIRERYLWVRSVLQRSVSFPGVPAVTLTDRIDAVVTHRVWGSLSLLLVLGIVFQSIYAGSAPLMDGIGSLFGALSVGVGRWIPEGPLQSLLADGVIGGVGGVLTFLPQIAVLFMFMAVLEDCGYMARAAFLTDRLFRSVGLTGRSVIPLISCFACAVPGIMAARVIENRKQRFATILVAPLISCSARLPVYVLFIGAFVPAETFLGGWIGLQGLVLFAMHLAGIVVAVPTLWLLNRTVLKSPPTPFFMELPSFKWPSRRTVLFRMYSSVREFVGTAGTIILAMAIVVWALSYYPHPEAIHAKYEMARRAAPSDQHERLHAQESAEYLRQSYFGRMGKAIEPSVRPLGWNWEIGMAVIASFPAREVVISTLGTIYNLGRQETEENRSLVDVLRSARREDGSPVFTLAVALSIMVFFALCCQCGATLATIKRETGTWRLPLLTFGYLTAVAYLASLAVYQLARHLGG